MSEILHSTVDGVPIQVGSSVWRINAGNVRRMTIARHHLALWWSWLRTQIYSTEPAALRAAIEAEILAAKRAYNERRRAFKAVARFSDRLEKLPS